MPAQNLPGLLLDRAHPLSRGLVLWLPMNEGGGGVTFDVVSGKRATLTNGPVRTGGKDGGGALTFDGSDDYITIPHDPALALLGDMSWFCFIRPVTYGNHHCLPSKATVNWGNPFDMRLENGTGVITHCRGTASSNSCASSTSSAPLNRWTHIGATQKGTAVRFFFNGGLDSTGTVSITPTDASGALRIGVRVDSATKMNGQLTHVRVYNRALLDSEVAQLYADPMAGALALSRLTRYYTAPTADPPAVPTRPLSADRLNNRTFARNWRRGETG